MKPWYTRLFWTTTWISLGNAIGREGIPWSRIVSAACLSLTLVAVGGWVAEFVRDSRKASK